MFILPHLKGLTAGYIGSAAFKSASLDLKFADNKSLTDAITGSSLVTFTRASSGTFVDSAGVLQTAATDVPRFDHNPTTGESLGLLVEEQRTNLIVQSENLGTTWTTTGLLAFGSGSTLNAAVAPDGQTTADLATEDSSTSEHRIETAAISWVANTTYTLTIFAKANGRTRVDFFGVGGGNFTGGRNASFNLSTGTVITTDGAVASIEARPDGWYRVRMTFTASAAPSASSIFIRFLDNSSNFSYTGDGTSGIYLWGAQLEAGALPTTYIPTTTAAVTRSADVASITGSAFSGWYNASQGSLHAEYSIPFDSSVSQFPILAGFSDNTFNNVAYHYNRTIDDGRRASVRSGGTTSFDQSNAGAYVYGQIGRQAFAYTSSEFAFSAIGVAPTVSSSITWPTVDRFGIGNTAFVGGSLTPLNGHIRRLCYWPTRLGNATLQQITQ